MPTAANSSLETLILARRDIAALMRVEDYLTAAEESFRAGAEGRAHAPEPMHLQGHGGAFHAKGASYDGDRSFVALKLNGNFPNNASLGLPTIQGMIALSDAADGRLLALMDSIEITLWRTAAASALAARYLARRDSKIIAICGCGAQAGPQLAAMKHALPIEECLAWDVDRARAAAFAGKAGKTLGIAARAAASHREACLAADVIVTCTTSREAFLYPEDVRAGTFIAAIGADAPVKSEISPQLMAAGKVVVDSLEQCLVMGDLHHAVAAGLMTADDVHASVSALVTGTKLGRSSAGDITVFDSTGIAIQDVTAAVEVYTRALAERTGARIALGA